MRDVADRADVSLKTVSRVVNREPNVSQDLRDRVDSAIAELGYRLDDGARSLRTTSRSTRTIGFVQVDHGNPFFSSLYDGLETVARAHGYLVLSGSTEKDARLERNLVGVFLARRVDGLVIIGVDDDYSYLRSERERGTPIVFVDFPPNGLDVSQVRTDHRRDATRAVEHLIRHGHRRIAFMGDELRWYSARERLAGYESALENAGIELVDELICPELPGVEAARQTTHRLLDSAHPPTAIFAAQNLVCIGAITALHEAGLEDKIALVGFDEIDIATLVKPNISVVPQYPTELAQYAGQLLFDQIDGIRTETVVEVLSHEVIARGSGEIPGPHG